jgi:hypothetical protein
MKRKPGTVLRGRIVDPHGQSIAPATLLQERMTSTAPELQPRLMSVRAVPDGAEAVDGIIDFRERVYDLVLPDGFCGRIELRIAGTVVGTVPLPDLSRAPDLPCDVNLLPRDGGPTTFVARFVDAESKEPIDIEDLESLPSAYSGDAIQARLRRDGSDPKHGVLVYGCNAGELTLEPRLPGYAPRSFRVTVPEGGETEPRTFALERTSGTIGGFVFHADGRPFGKARLVLYRVAPEGLIDATGTNMATNPDGQFHFRPLAKGEHVLVACGSPDDAPGISRFVVDESATYVEVHCRRGIASQFRVVTTGATPNATMPLPNTRFRIVDSNGVTIEDSHREWPPEVHALEQFTAMLAEGRYTIVVARKGFRESRVEFEVPASTAISIPLEPTAPASK